MDGSEFCFHSNRWDQDAYVRGASRKERGYFAVHLTAAYDLLSRKYVDAIIQPSRLKNEHDAVCRLVASGDHETKRLLLADRGFGSYNFYLHARNAALDFLIRLPKNQTKALLGEATLQSLGETFDTTIIRRLVRTRRRSGYLHPEEPDSYRVIGSTTQFDHLEPGDSREIALSLRIVRIRLDDGSYEDLVTTLNPSAFPPRKLKQLYRLRWGIETSFLHLKHTIGCEYFHSCKRELMIQEIWARMILYNFCMEIARHAALEKRNTRKYAYRINVTQAMKACHEFLAASDALKACIDITSWILKADAVPVRDGRHYRRKPKSHGAKPLNYR